MGAFWLIRALWAALGQPFVAVHECQFAESDNSNRTGLLPLGRSLGPKFRCVLQLQSFSQNSCISKQLWYVSLASVCPTQIVGLPDTVGGRPNCQENAAYRPGRLPSNAVCALITSLARQEEGI